MFSKNVFVLLARRSVGGHLRIMNSSNFATTSSSAPSTSKLLLRGAALGAGIGVVYSVYTHYDINQKKNKPPIVEAVKPKIMKTLPKFEITRTVKNLGKEANLELVLFQYQSCPFCSKVRAFLNANGISYSVVEVDSITRKAIKWSDYKKVPTLLVKTKNGYVQLTDSSAIISIISSYLLDRNQNIEDIMNYYPIMSYVDDEGKTKDEILNKYFLMFNEKKSVSKEEIERERRWRKWTDDVLIHTICPNIYRTVDESFKTLNFFADVGEWREIFGNAQSWLMINGGTYAMWIIGKIVKNKYKYEDDVRKPLYEACQQWTQELNKKNAKFMGGSIPDLSDLAVYGLLNCIEGSEAFKDVTTHTNINPWFTAMKEYVIKNTKN